MFIIIVFLSGYDRPSGLLYFVPALFFSILTPLLISSSVSSSYFVLAVPMRECLEKHSCISFPFSIAILNGICFFSGCATTSVQCIFGAKNYKQLCTSKPMLLNKLN